jgi:hypothetical protein
VHWSGWIGIEQHHRSLARVRVQTPRARAVVTKPRRRRFHRVHSLHTIDVADTPDFLAHPEAYFRPIETGQKIRTVQWQCFVTWPKMRKPILPGVPVAAKRTLIEKRQDRGDHGSRGSSAVEGSLLVERWKPTRSVSPRNRVATTGCVGSESLNWTALRRRRGRRRPSASGHCCFNADPTAD